jgi:hypothetical protein
MKALQVQPLLAAVCLSVTAASYRHVPYQEKLGGRDVSLCVTFDKRHVNADSAGGNPHATTLKNLDLGLRGMVGFDGAPAFKPEGTEELTFNIHDNVDLRQGTVVMWLNGSNFAPGDVKTDGEKRGNVAFLHMVFRNADARIDYRLYEYGGTVYFDWSNSLPPQGWGSVGRVQTALTGIAKGEWFQLAVTWGPTELNLYLNGEIKATGRLPLKAAETLDLIPDPALSFLGLKSRFHGDKNTWEVVLDDVRVYSRALRPLEIKNAYLGLVQAAEEIVLQGFDLQLNGVDDGTGDLGRLEVALDFHTLTEAQQAQLQAGHVKTRYSVSGPAGFNNSGTWELAKLETCRIIDGVTTPGTYTVTVTIEFPDSKKESVTAEVERPDLSFVDTHVGDEDTVPPPWTPLIVGDDRSVTVWNRVYRFGDGPFPSQIHVAGKPLLKVPPQLRLATAEGEAAIRYEFTGTKRGRSWVEFSGRGQADSFSLSYTTRIEFDGLLKTDFVINGTPRVSLMTLTWAVNPAYAEHLMTPTLQQSESGEFAFAYPNRSWNTTRQLWLASEQGGFCWAMVNDANWVHGADQEIFRVNRNTGECEVTMIAAPTTLPPATPYQALFIPTPTRPLPERNRVIRFHDGSRPDAPKLLCCAGEGLAGHATFKPHEAAFATFMKRRAPGSVAVYGMADALTTTTSVAHYLGKYWNVPGAYVYNCTYQKPTADGKTEAVKCFSVSACARASFPDYILNNIQGMFQHPCGDRVWMIYYDLCGNRLCSNPLHGCAFKDKFGRTIKSFSLLTKRELVKRTVRLCHRHNRTVMLHAQRSFFPMFTGLTDYWFPGEQHGGMLRRNPYGYTDELPDILYRTEYNRDLLGAGVIFLPALGSAKREYFKVPEYTEAMLSMLLPHDIESAKLWAAGGVMYRVWSVFEKYGIDSPSVRVHRYFEQATVTSTNPDLRLTWYECPGQRTLIILANKTPEPQSGTLDLSALAAGSFPVRAEYSGQDLMAKAGRLDITCPARGFRILAFPPKTFYPHEDGMSERWSNWQSEGAVGTFNLDRKTGCAKAGSLLIEPSPEAPADGSFCFVNRFPAVPGRTYTAKVSIKTTNRSPGARVTMGFQAQDEKVHFLGLPPQSAALADGGAPEWESLVLAFTVPTTGKWAKTCHLLVTLGTKNNPGGSVWFDDFQIRETPAPGAPAAGSRAD